MAVFFKNERTSDDYEKHSVTEAEILFLKELQKEMNTQDTFATADPRYWIIKGKRKLYYADEEDADGIDLLDKNNRVCAAGLENIASFIKNMFSINCHYDSENNCITVYDGNGSDDIWLYTVQEINDLLKKYFVDRYHCENFVIETYDYPNTLFLTYEDAVEHLKKYSYHYDKDAHPYCCCAQMSPRLERLYKILHEVDFGSMIGKDKSE